MCYTLRLFTLVRIFQIAVHYIRYMFTGSKNGPIKKELDTKHSSLNVSIIQQFISHWILPLFVGWQTIKS